MKKADLARWWHAFLSWPFWRRVGAFFVRAWKATVRWRFWGKFFGVPFALLLILCVFCAVGLVWVMATGREQWLPAYFLYALSAYGLTALCIRLPSEIRKIKEWLRRHPKLQALLKNEEAQFSLELYFEQFLNFGYGVYKIGAGVVLGSAWIGADGIYNMAQALIQLFQILRRKKPGTLLQQWRSYRVCGLLILLMHLTLTGIVFQMLNWHRVEAQGPIMIIATAAFAFYKFISSFLHVAKDRKHHHPIDSSVRMLELSQAIFAIFSLQAGLLHTFGTGESWESMLNVLTGCTVCLLVAAMGVYMIRRGNREIRKIQEHQDGA